MTQKQIIVCTILAFLAAPRHVPDLVTNLTFSFPATLLTCIVLILFARSDRIKTSHISVRRLIAGTTTAAIVLAAHVAQLLMMVHAMKEQSI